MGILVPYFRSSSYTNWDFCELQYYQIYALGYGNPPLLKAEMGTAVHRVMEILGGCKKMMQDGKKRTYQDDAIGKVKFNNQNFYTDKFVDELIERVYNYYRSNSHNDWDKKISGVSLDGKNIYDSTSFVRKLCYKTLRGWDGFYDPRNKQILEVEKHFDLPIEEDWATFEHEGKKIQLHIKGTIDCTTILNENTIEVQDYKGLPIETKIPTPHGWTTMGDIQVGDIVFDKDGHQVLVMGKSKLKYLDCYRLTFDDGSTIECDEEHLWLINNTDIKRIDEVKVKDNIYLCNAVQCQNKHLPIDPYVLGIWLGNGRNRSFEICSGDKEVFKEIEKRNYKLGEPHKANRIENYQTRTVLNSTKILRQLGLLHNKHIPNSYLRSSVQQRLDLLNGLMDSDGNYNQTRNQCVFSNTNLNLINDVYELIISLGQRAKINYIKQKYKNKIIDVYQITFTPINNIKPFNLERKNDLISNQISHKSNKRQIRSINKIGKKHTQCISVNSKSSTFLCGEQFLVTHNTGQRKDFATGEEKNYEKLCKDPQLLLYNYALSKLYPEYENRIMSILFIRDGGPFSMCFEDEDLKMFVGMLKDRFFEISKTTNPKPISKNRNDWKCKYVCAFSQPDPETGKIRCKHVEDTIKTYGIDLATEKLKNKDFDPTYYEAPG